MPRSSSGGGGSSQRARSGSSGAFCGGRLGPRAIFRARLLVSVSRRGSVTLRREDLAVAQLVFDELAHRFVLERAPQVLWLVRIGDLQACVQGGGGGENT